MKSIVLACFVCLGTVAVGQKQANNWYLQDYGVDFNQNPPDILTEVAFHQNRSSGVISDKNGSLLFYTDNFNVFNRFHEKMPNGKNLLDLNQTSNSYQNSIVIPKPGSETLFYVFMSDPYNSTTQGGLYYFTVDMSLDNGKGDVSVRPIKLLPLVSRKMAAVLHANRTDVWVTVNVSNTNTYKSFLVTSAGIGDPVSTSIGTVVSNSAQMKFSPDGKLIASSNDYSMDLFDFDASTGVLSNARVIQNPQSTWLQGVSFSPDGKKLYAASQAIVQWDVSSGDASVIKASEKIVAGYVNNNFYDLQLATDGVIYSTKGGGGGTSDYFGAITNSNDADAKVVEKYLYLGGFDSFVNWTPLFIESYFLQPGIVVENNCFGETTKFSLSNSIYVQGVKWNFGEGEIQTSMAAEHIFSSAGDWNVEVEIDYGTYKVVARKTVTINPVPSFDLGPDRTVCNGLTLRADVEGEASYQWNTGGNTNNIVLRTSGTYSAETEYPSTGCKFFDEVTVTVNETPFVDLGPDSVVCNMPAYVLKSRKHPLNAEFKWNDPTVTGDELTVTTGGFYWLEAKNTVNGCTDRDSVFLALKFAPDLDLGHDRMMTNEGRLELDMSQYGSLIHWENGSNSPVRILVGEDLTFGENTITAELAGNNGCVAHDEMIVTVVDVTGLEDQVEFTLYPNPVVATLYVETPGEANISLFTITGKLVTQQIFTSGEGSVDVSNYSDGLYIVEVTVDSKTSRRIVVKR
jgi:WD40 repeat protein